MKILGTIKSIILSTYVFRMNVLNNSIKEGNFVKSRARYQALSPEVKNLIEGLLCKDVSKRLKVQEALDHPWITQIASEKISDDSASASGFSSEDDDHPIKME